MYLCIGGQITYLKRNGISFRCVRCFLIGTREREDIETVFVLYVVHLITTVASEIRGFVTNKLLVALVTCICIVIDASELILTQKNNTLDLVNQY